MSVPERARRAIGAAARRTFFRRFARTSAPYPTRCFAELDRHGAESRARRGNVVVESSPHPAEMAELVAGVVRDGRIRHVRDAAFFRWRFGNPTREYRFLYYERDGALDGFIAVAGYRKSHLAFNVVDAEARSDSVLAELLDAACAWGRFPAIGAWWASYSPAARRVLTRHGFVPIERGLRARGMPCVLLKKIGSASAAESAVDRAAWDIRLIDSMSG